MTKKLFEDHVKQMMNKKKQKIFTYANCDKTLKGDAHEAKRHWRTCYRDVEESPEKPQPMTPKKTVSFELTDEQEMSLRK